MKKNIIVASIILLSCLLLAAKGLAVITSGPVINPGISTIYTDQILSCHFMFNETTSANVSWYQNGVFSTSQNSIACAQDTDCSTSGIGNIPAVMTFKGDIWKCLVLFYNGSAYDNRSTNVTIIDSPPAAPRIYYPNGSEIANNSNINMAQDFVSILNATSTDADGDTVTYLISGAPFCSINSITGIISCAPSLMSDLGNWTLRIGADTLTATTYSFQKLNVTPTNGAPYFSPSLVSRSVLEGQALNYGIAGADREGNTPYNFSMYSDLPNLILNITSQTSAVIMFNNSGMDIALYSDKGNHTVNITITDSDPTNPKNFTASFVLQVIPINHPPSINYYVFNSTSLIQGGNLSIYVNSTDLDNDSLSFYTNSSLYSLSYEATDKSNPSGISFAYGWINITGLTNDNVVSRDLRITVTDGKQNTSADIFLNITNINDPPLINNKSFYSVNTQGNINLSYLQGYSGVLLKYVVNATDPDLLTYEGDTLSFVTNDSRIIIGSSTGLIQFVPNFTGNISYTINVTDSKNASFVAYSNLSVLPNTDPYFLVPNITLQCYEFDSMNYPVNCYYNVSANVTDNDTSDYVAVFTSDSTFFNISSDGIINFSAAQENVGSYGINITVYDTRGGQASTILYMVLNNTNNPPEYNLTVLPPGNLVVGNNYLMIIYASDLDLLLSNTYENITFNATYNGTNPLLFNLTKVSDTEARINFFPSSSADAGRYDINISVKDFFNNVSFGNISFFIYNRTAAPLILNITPFGTPLQIGSVNTSWMDIAAFPNMTTTISISENQAYTFNQTSSADSSSYQNNLTYEWLFDSVSVSNKSSFTKYFDYFSSGSHVVTFVVRDLYGSSNNFTWMINVANVNRPPVLVHPLDPITANGTTTFANYLSYYNDQTKFYDPDDDPQGEGKANGNKSTLTYSATGCAYATFQFLLTDLSVKAKAVGSCSVNITAYDGQNAALSVIASDVLINITEISNDTSETTPRPIIVSGGGSSSRTITVPVPQDVNKPIPLQIITPQLVTVYKNSSVKVPIVLNNTWTDDLEGVTLSAIVNATNVTMHLDNNYFPRIPFGTQVDTVLTINNYKSDGHYEIQIRANVTNPDFVDTATIFINSADVNSEGDAIQTKISFAQDLLSSNPECQELNEILTQAKKAMVVKDYMQSGKLVNDVINGCKYLVSTKSQNNETAQKNFVTRLSWDKRYTTYAIIAGFSVLMLTALYYVFKKEDYDKNF